MPNLIIVKYVVICCLADVLVGTTPAQDMGKKRWAAFVATLEVLSVLL